VTAAIVASPEYYLDHGSSNLGFVQALYQQVLGRPGSSSEYNPWVNAMNAAPGSSTRGAIALAFLTSTEYGAGLVGGGGWAAYYPMWGGFYPEFQQRAAGAAELAGWVQPLQSGMSDQAVLAGILGSPEGFGNWS
jgi:hypothetical protein